MPFKSRYVHLSQQALVAATVAAVAAPALTVATLDLVGPSTGRPAAERGVPAGDRSATALVAAEPVAPEVTEVPVEDVSAEGLDALEAPRAEAAAAERLAALSAPEPVAGYATVGVTWAPGVHVEEDEITVSVRTLEDGTWSDWQPVEYHDDHGPDPDSAEGRQVRQGTEPLVVGDVDSVQVRAVTATGEAPEGMSLAVVDPGEAEATAVQEPAIDTAALDTAALDDTGSDTGSDTGDAAALAAGRPLEVTPKPRIFSRAQWGADERMRDKSSLTYHEVHAGFVHHTVNANDYSRKQVPSLLRGIYAYHTQSRGWSDLGYNFVVDRFGRIWEGRYGGVDRPVVGAHTLGYNEYSFAASALGNFDVVRPSSAMLDAYARLFAWKLSLHGVSASSSAQWVGSRSFPAVNGHRDAGSTACPGRYLYAKVGRIRSAAAAYQKPFSSRTRSTDVAGSPWPDLVVRDRQTKRALVVRTGGQVGFQPRQVAGTGWGGMDLLTAAGDLTGDGVPDMLGRNRRTGLTAVYPGTPRGTFGRPVATSGRFRAADQLTGVRNMRGNKRNDVVARHGESKRLLVFRGDGKGGFKKRRVLARDWSGYNLTAGVGDLSGDGRNDLVARSGKRLYLVPGRRGGIGTPVRLPGFWAKYDLIAGTGDLTGDGRADLVARNRKSRLAYIFPGDGRGGLGHWLGPFAQFKNVSYLAAAGQLAGDRNRDLVARDRDGRLLVFPHDGGRNIEAVTGAGTSLEGVNLVLNVGDWNGDGHGDVMTRVKRTGVLQLRRGNGQGGFAAPVTAGTGWKRVGLVAAVGDLTGDGFPDLVGQPRGAAMRVYPGNGGTGFKPGFVARAAVSSRGQTGLGLWDGDGSPDSLMRTSDGSLVLYPGNGPGGLLRGRKVAGGADRYDWLQALGDATGDGRPDLVGREKATGTLWLLPGTAKGFGARRYLGAGFERFDRVG